MLSRQLALVAFMFPAPSLSAARAGEPPTARIMVNPVAAKVGPAYPPLVGGGPNIVGNELRLDAGGVRVWVEVQLADWDPNGDGSPAVGDFVVTLDGSGLLDADIDGDGDVSDDGDQEDIVQPIIPCTNHGDCIPVFGEPAANPCEQGRCTPVYSDKGHRDDSWCDENCCGVGVDVTDSGWSVYMCTQNARAGDGTIRWGATAIYDVPAGAKGRYIVELDADETYFLTATSPPQEIPSLSETGFVINVLTGRCCFASGTSSADCVDAVTREECAQKPGPFVFTPEERCPPEGPACETVTGACCNGDPFEPCADAVILSQCQCARCQWSESATCDAVDCARVPIPTTSTWGLAVLALALTIASKIVFRSRWSKAFLALS